MKLIRYRCGSAGPMAGLWCDDRVIPLQDAGGRAVCLEEVLEAPVPREAIERWQCPEASMPVEAIQWEPPIDRQEVWAAGVTYKRSQKARMEESTAAASCYDRVYQSPRPELFFKATPHRVSGHCQPLRIRSDASWNVPEPELTLVINSRKELVGFTIGNDMSSRDIEGENPLYLPQAKVYDQCCGLGPCITLADAMPPPEAIGIRMTIERGGKPVFQGSTSIREMARTFSELIGWLSRDNSFPYGAFLLTGTGIVPDSDFTLRPGDWIRIQIDGIGELANPVVQG
ncbi:MAG: 2-hydroxyhepta-2,4-diene-1,7-dioate isomerase [Pirellulaceae bacterium]|nr:MAG: 2-hydroxyhepta-2,4-diene-1,7-dioate isomerase [Pirellulaceae bacterium]